jgi:putative ABC transport system permease protein
MSPPDQTPRPPRWAEKLLERTCPPRDREEVQGDLLELYHYWMEQYGVPGARRRYAFNVLRLLPAFSRKRRFALPTKPPPTDMIRSYFTIAVRNLRRRKTYTAINVGGLALGMTTTVLLLLWVQDELSYDRFHRNGKNIYRVVPEMDISGEQKTFSFTPGPLAVFSKQQIPGVVQAVRKVANFEPGVLAYKDKTFSNEQCGYVDPAFFSVFDYPVIQGNAKNPFPTQQSIVVTQSTARKYFGAEEPVGKSMLINGKDYYTVTGVIADIPAHSDIRYDIFFPFSILDKKLWKSPDEDWGNYNYQTFLLLLPDASPEAVGRQLTAIHRSHLTEALSAATVAKLFDKLQPLHQLHLYHPDGSEAGMQTVRIFGIVAMVVLLIACVNYVNLSTAQATQRAKEVGIRKVIGAQRQQVFGQFMGESSLVFGLAFGVACLLIRLLLPLYNGLSGKQLVFGMGNPQLFVGLAVTLVITLLVAGIYPALLLASFQPLHVLKGKLPLGASGASFRKVLVTAQFTASVVLIVGTLIIGRQLAYIRNKELGYQKENVYTFWMRGEMSQHFERIRTQLEEQPDVQTVTASNNSMVDMHNDTSDNDWDGKDPDRLFQVYTANVEANFLSFFQMQLAAGKGFSGTKADSTAFILNETAVRRAGIINPVGKRFRLWQTEGTIIGVVKDFHYKSIHQAIEPMVFYRQGQGRDLLYVRTGGWDAADAIAATEELWKQYNPAFPFHYSFLDDNYDKLYKAEQRTGVLFRYFAGIAIFISCLGLYGLAAYTARRRTREVGIRKVLGASVTAIVLLLSQEFLKPVAVALAVAVPLAWYAAGEWLANFAYSVGREWWIFGLAGALSLLIVLLSVGFQAIRAALIDPADVLRSE